MSLTDLKKSSDDKGKKKKFTVDEFISDSENYAKGSPEIVSSDVAKQHDLAKAIEGARALVERRAEQERLGIKASNKKISSKKVTKIKKSPAKPRDPNKKKPFRHATFTLSEEVIAQLQFLANETGLAKSHIVRILINELDDQEKVEQLKQSLDDKLD
ncbi:hypothetical protein [Thalassotalea sp. PLHSN55]|uniref:hypothetical protein n=1 Tax=Thalassotalea sp. PLHSN55 TaxID=3435888 RepID=UPI003F8556D9